jgi:hypothetical protein
MEVENAQVTCVFLCVPQSSAAKNPFRTGKYLPVSNTVQQISVKAL